MTPADKEKIRAAIAKATGQKVGEIYPEFFLSATVGGAKLFPMLIKTEKNTAVLLGVFFNRKAPTDAGQAVRPNWQFGMN